MSEIAVPVADRDVEFPNRYRMTQAGDGLIELVPEPGAVASEGTVVGKEVLELIQTKLQQDAASKVAAETSQRQSADNALTNRINALSGVSGWRILAGNLHLYWSNNAVQTTLSYAGKFKKAPYLLLFEDFDRISAISGSSYVYKYEYAYHANTAQSCEIVIAQDTNINFNIYGTSDAYFRYILIGEAA